MQRFLRLSILLAGLFAAATAQPLTSVDDLGPKVVQPIEFPHDRHAGDAAKGGMQINCMYCHSAARRSEVAGIPPLAKCIDCHRSIPSVRETPRIKKLFEYWQAKQPIPWKKVHDLPDFVRFSHERHIQRFVFQQGQPVQAVCAHCHGDVKTMTVARRTKSLSMASCVDCHRKDHALDSSGGKTSKGPHDCTACHK